VNHITARSGKNCKFMMYFRANQVSKYRQETRRDVYNITISATGAKMPTEFIT
jgi:hypothetical protein